jgi:hypothetical protein
MASWPRRFDWSDAVKFSPSILLVILITSLATTRATAGQCRDAGMRQAMMSLIDQRRACFAVERDQERSDRCAERINERLVSMADHLIMADGGHMPQGRLDAWKARQTTLCEQAVPFDRGGSGFGEAMDSCLADAIAKHALTRTP